MSNVDEVIQRIETECDLPDGWGAFQTGGMPGNIEISGYDGENIQTEIVEVIDGNITEVVIGHADMPGRASADKMDELEEPVLEVPSQVGVLQFDNIDDGIKAVDHLTDPSVLAEIVSLRSAIETDEPLSVREAVAEVTDIDMSTVQGTLTAI